jgi:hypothetical protein
VHAIVALFLGTVGVDLDGDGGHVRLRCRRCCRVSCLSRLAVELDSKGIMADIRWMGSWFDERKGLATGIVGESSNAY